MWSTARWCPWATHTKPHARVDTANDTPTSTSPTASNTVEDKAQAPITVKLPNVPTMPDAQAMLRRRTERVVSPETRAKRSAKATIEEAVATKKANAYVWGLP